MNWQTFFAMGGFAPFVWSSFSVVIFVMSFAGFLVFKRYRFRLKQFYLYSKQLDFGRGAARDESRSLQMVNEEANESCNKAENSSAKSMHKEGK